MGYFQTGSRLDLASRPKLPNLCSNMLLHQTYSPIVRCLNVPSLSAAYKWHKHLVIFMCRELFYYCGCSEMEFLFKDMTIFKVLSTNYQIVFEGIYNIVLLYHTFLSTV